MLEGAVTKGNDSSEQDQNLSPQMRKQKFHKESGVFRREAGKVPPADTLSIGIWWCSGTDHLF